MELITKDEIERSESGFNEFPYDVLVRMSPDILVDASAAYSKLVADNPNYKIGIVQDPVQKKLTVYWNRVV